MDMKLIVYVCLVNFVAKHGAFQADSKARQRSLRSRYDPGVQEQVKTPIKPLRDGFFLFKFLHDATNSPTKCTPGRTVLKMEKKQLSGPVDPASDEFMRRYDTPEGYDDEKCSICVCSADGRNEACIKRPVDSLNECMRMEAIKKKQERGEPFELTNTLAYRMRRGGGGVVDTDGIQPTCVPSVSKYSDCTEANKCDGCTKCVCSAAGLWSCKSVQECDEEESDYIDDQTFDAAVDKLDMEVKDQKAWVKDVMDHTRIGLQNWDISKSSKADKTVQDLTYREEKKEYHNGPDVNKDNSEGLLGYVITVPRQRL